MDTDKVTFAGDRAGAGDHAGIVWGIVRGIGPLRMIGTLLIDSL